MFMVFGVTVRMSMVSWCWADWEGSKVRPLAYLVVCAVGVLEER